MTEHITSAQYEGVLTLTLNRPEKKNALSEPMYATLADEIGRAQNDPSIRVVLIRSQGDVFTSGNDISTFAAHAQGGPTTGPAAVERFVDALITARKPVVAAVRGLAVGIGLTMLLHCDVVVVAEDARLSAPFVNLALVPEASSSTLMAARVGHLRAFSIFGLGEVIDGATAAEWGLATKAVDASDVEDEASRLAGFLASRPRGSLASTKALMRDPVAMQATVRAEMEAFGRQLSSSEAREVFTAFAQRRAPDFSVTNAG